MDKNEALKIMDGLRAIKKHCEKFDPCTECEFNNGAICIMEKLGKTPVPYWNLEELEYKLNKAIETEEKQQHEAVQQDMIHHPGHYNFRGMECKDFIEKFVADPKSYTARKIKKRRGSNGNLLQFIRTGSEAPASALCRMEGVHRKPERGLEQYENGNLIGARSKNDQVRI